MQFLSDKLLLSASDLINHLECEHLTMLDLTRAKGDLAVEPKSGDVAELLSRKGDEHERRHLEALRAEHGAALVEIDAGERGYAELEAAAEATKEAMAAGAPVIFQAAFLHDDWMGYADFLERRDDRPSDLGDYSYEVVDTKLARSVKPYFVVQLCLYSEFVARIQGVEPERMHVLLGNGERESLALSDFSAYFRRLRASFVAQFDEGGIAGTYPEPVEHCAICRWADHCDERRLRDDHLSLVAGLGRAQSRRLAAGGIRTVAELAQARSEYRPQGVSSETFERLRRQAELQVKARTSGDPLISELLPLELPGSGPLRGFARLPEPSEGDLFFDIEGDPLYEDGLEYLWGVTYVEDGERRFQAFWGTDRGGEKRAFEQFMDFVHERRQRYPDMHVYHYAPYEPTALKRMMGLHASREDEVDDLLRQHVLVDLYRVVVQSLRISRPSYSIKEVERFYMPERQAALKAGGDSILMFEEWLASHDQKVLDDIEAYNREDCDSTLMLRDWLIEQKRAAERELGVDIPWRRPGQPPEGEKPNEREGEFEVALLQERLLRGVPEDPAERSDDQRDRWLLAQLLDYHRREAKPAWWEHFDRLERSDEELTERDSEAIAGLVPVGAPEPIGGRSRSVVQKLRFPAQEHKVKPGKYADPHSCGVDPQTGESDSNAKVLTVLAIDDGEGTLDVRLGPARHDDPPTALIPGRPYQTTAQRESLRAIAHEVVGRGLDGMTSYPAARELLRRALPRTDAVAPGEPLQPEDGDIEQLKRIVRGLDGSYLFIQGPPGSGKTYTGAQLILDLLASGARVGVTSNSHKAIHNLLHEVEAHAGPAGVEFAGLNKSSSDGEPFVSRLPQDRMRPLKALIEDTPEPAVFPPPAEVTLISGTAWLWCREDMRDCVDYLFVDEAGQMSLADAIAVTPSTKNAILLGDPLQLAQVSLGTHPPGAGASVLEHLLGAHGAVPPERGVFLEHTRRMHPDVCELISEMVYEGRLESIPECAVQKIDATDSSITGTGVRSILIEHEGNSRQSPEEAERIAAEAMGLIGARYTKANGDRVKLEPSDLMVVTPYNAQVRCLREALAALGLVDAAVGTVDKFQGQEAAIVFFSMATSTGAEVPRNVEFLYSRDRLNVAVSRARCIGVLVASPDLLTITCRTVEQMRLVNALCLLDEKAQAQG